MTISEALLDQRALAGIGNIWRNETLFVERTDPFATVASLDDDHLRRLVATARRLLAESASLAPGRGADARLPASRPAVPALRDPDPVAPAAAEIPRTTYWCPRCQAGPADGRRGQLRPGGGRLVGCEVDGRRGRAGAPSPRPVGAADLARLDPAATAPSELVRRSFELPARARARRNRSSRRST